MNYAALGGGAARKKGGRGIIIDWFKSITAHVTVVCVPLQLPLFSLMSHLIDEKPHWHDTRSTWVVTMTTFFIMSLSESVRGGYNGMYMYYAYLYIIVYVANMMNARVICHTILRVWWEPSRKVLSVNTERDVCGSPSFNPCTCIVTVYTCTIWHLLLLLIYLFIIYLFIYCHLYSAFSIVQCSNALYRLWDGEIQGHTGQPSVREIDAHTMYNSMSNRSWPKPQLS